MSKKKHPVALFEVMHKTADKPGPGAAVPGWMGGKQEPGAPEGRHEETLQGMLPRPPGIANGRFGEPKRPILSSGAGRLNVSLGAVSGPVIGLVLVVLIGGAFLLGRCSSRPRTEQGPGQGVLPPDGPGESQDGLTLPARESGKYYLVIQDLGVGIADGKMTQQGQVLKVEGLKIAEFLNNHKIKAMVNSWKGTHLIVGSLDGFSSPTSAEAREYARKIEALGKTYLESGGRWNFGQRNRQGQLDPLFWRQP